MRAVALADPEIQSYIQKHFVPLKLEVLPGAKELPVNWSSLLGWRLAYKYAGGPTSKGFTGCMVVSADLKTLYGGTGSASIAELFDSVAYDREKFLAMLKLTQKRRLEEESIRSDSSLGSRERSRKMRQFRRKIHSENWAARSKKSKRRGFRYKHAMELLRMSGDRP